MSPRYHIVLTRTDGQWELEFGSYVKSEVNFEADDLRSKFRRVDIHLMTTGDTQPEIDAAVAQLNKADAIFARLQAAR